MKQYDIAIIGAGPAGLYAHYYAGIKGFKSCLLEANNEVGGQPSILFPIKSIHDYPGFKDIKGSELVNMFVNQIEDKSNIFTNTTVKSINKTKDGYELITNHESYCAKYIILATGGGFFKFNKINGIESKNIHYCVKNLEQYRNKKIIIAGGGDSAVDWAIEILKNNITNDLTIVHRREEFRANGSKIEILKSYPQCKILLNKSSEVTKDNELTVVDNTTKKLDKLPFDYLIVQYGQVYSLADNNLLSLFKLDKINRVIVDANGKTGVNNIYAIGNVASFENKPRLISVAVVDAIKAIENIVKEIKQYE